MKQITILILMLLYINSTHAQGFNKSLNKDSLLQVISKNIPEEIRSDMIKMYNSKSEKEKGSFLFMLSVFYMTKDNKKGLISNIDSNYDKVDHLKTEYAKLVPPNYAVRIEFEPANQLTNTKESIDLRITGTEKDRYYLDQDWHMPHNSARLSQMLKVIHWNKETLKIIKKLLDDAHCISIENGEIVTIGFARSGMGEYLFKLFDKDLTPGQMKQFNDGCTYIFYKQNIVLEYQIGAIGSPCFPK